MWCHCLSFCSLFVLLVHATPLQEAEDASNDLQSPLQDLLDGQRDLLANIEEQHQNLADEMRDLRQLLMTDECADGSHNCSEFATCTDTCAHYKCSCLPGYSGNGYTCQDIDECNERRDICGVHGTCINHPIGSYSCNCDEGFREEHKLCKDIDECFEQPDVCGFGSKCINNQGGFECLCKDGFIEAGGRCRDMDECEMDLHHCHTYATCTNNNGSYTCDCNALYDGDGFTCAGPNCRAPYEGLTGVGCVYVDTTKRSWQDSQESCHTLNGRLFEDFTSADLKAMSFKYSAGIRYIIWVGIFDGLWINSQQQPDEGLWYSGEPQEKQCGYVDLSSKRMGDGECDLTTYSICQQVE